MADEKDRVDEQLAKIEEDVDDNKSRLSGFEQEVKKAEITAME